MPKTYYIYILASGRNGTLYIGVTSDLARRVWEHKQKFVEGFTKKYDVNKLVYFETCHDPLTAIHREKRLKKYSRKWKLNLIEAMNPEWKDFYEELIKPGLRAKTEKMTGLPGQAGQ